MAAAGIKLNYYNVKKFLDYYAPISLENVANLIGEKYQHWSLVNGQSSIAIGWARHRLCLTQREWGNSTAVPPHFPLVPHLLCTAVLNPTHFTAVKVR